jgi:ribosomal protein L40E
MSATRPNLTRPQLTLDEQSFQGLLSAAFTIQEHNDRRRQARQTIEEAEVRREPESQNLCSQCGAPKAGNDSRCGNCGADELRPGERLQRNWASMWLMSQEQGLFPERSSEVDEATQSTIPDSLALPIAKKIARETSAPEADMIHDRLDIHSVWEKFAEEGNEANPSNEIKITEADAVEKHASKDFAPFSPEDSDRTFEPFELAASDDFYPGEAISNESADASDAVPPSMLQRLADLRVTLRFHRADLYLGVAVFVAMLALLWPAAAAPRRAALSPWDRALIALGIAEAPAPVIHLQGDPSIEVWVDPHTALYYCPGAEPFGKTAGGRISSQREAQLDRFEPAGRTVCE